MPSLDDSCERYFWARIPTQNFGLEVFELGSKNYCFKYIYAMDM